MRRAIQTNIAGGEATCDLTVCGGREKSTTEAGEVCRRGAVGRDDCAFQHGLHACADTSRADGHAWDAGGLLRGTTYLHPCSRC